jgi:hypothetical protein
MQAWSGLRPGQCGGWVIQSEKREACMAKPRHFRFQPFEGVWILLTGPERARLEKEGGAGKTVRVQD